MKELIPKDEYGIFADAHDTARVDSLFVAEFFEKNHKEVLRDIRKIIDPTSGLSEEFRQRNFAPSSYTMCTVTERGSVRHDKSGSGSSCASP